MKVCRQFCTYFGRCASGASSKEYLVSGGSNEIQSHVDGYRSKHLGDLVMAKLDKELRLF
jgi:hypothetical protein